MRLRIFRCCCCWVFKKLREGWDLWVWWRLFHCTPLILNLTKLLFFSLIDFSSSGTFSRSVSEWPKSRRSTDLEFYFVLSIFLGCSSYSMKWTWSSNSSYCSSIFMNEKALFGDISSLWFLEIHEIFLEITDLRLWSICVFLEKYLRTSLSIG